MAEGAPGAGAIDLGWGGFRPVNAVSTKSAFVSARVSRLANGGEDALIQQVPLLVPEIVSKLNR